MKPLIVPIVLDITLRIDNEVMPSTRIRDGTPSLLERAKDSPSVGEGERIIHRRHHDRGRTSALATEKQKQFIIEHPDMPLEELVAVLGVSRSRIYQRRYDLYKAGLVPKLNRLPPPSPMGQMDNEPKDEDTDV